MDLAEEHRLHVSRWFTACPPAMHRRGRRAVYGPGRRTAPGRGFADAVAEGTDLLLLSATTAPLGWHLAEATGTPTLGVYLQPPAPTGDFPRHVGRRPARRRGRAVVRAGSEERRGTHGDGGRRGPRTRSRPVRDRRDRRDDRRPGPRRLCQRAAETRPWPCRSFAFPFPVRMGVRALEVSMRPVIVHFERPLSTGRYGPGIRISRNAIGIDCLECLECLVSESMGAEGLFSALAESFLTRYGSDNVRPIGVCRKAIP